MSETKQGSVAASKLDFQRILVPIDFSERSRELLKYAAAFAARHDATLIMVHVVEPVIYPTEGGFGAPAPQEMETALKRSAEAKLKEWRGEEVAATAKVETMVRLGQPFMEITGAAKSEQADIIVISTHGYTGLKHVLLGSTAERVVRHAACPVLTLHQP